ncbi:MAG: SDR family oxidoreductase, partial [Lysobacteraceae bacterium]
IVHLAGANRPADPAEFMAVNYGSITALTTAIRASGRNPAVILSSSIRAGDATEYGRSKLAAEEELTAFAQERGTPVHIFRLPNVFGKWSRPDYNSAVATFCHRVARGLDIDIHDRSAPLTLVYIDDVVDAFIAIIERKTASGDHRISPCYTTTVGEVADTIQSFAKLRETGMIDRVGTGLTRALYATYVASLPPERFSYDITMHRDPRGAFAEMLKTPDAGQFSTFNAGPGVTRGGHYHHSKTEKFLVVHGRARFRFRHMISGERHELETDGDTLEIVETVPGWAHDITNIGSEVMVALLWANEVFDRSRPDTIAAGLDA